MKSLALTLLLAASAALPTLGAAAASALPRTAAAADATGAAGVVADYPAPAPIPGAPQVDATSYELMDYTTGQVLASRNADRRMAPASLTKLMTAYVVFHALAAGTLKLDDQVTISEHAWKAEGSRTFVKLGSQVPVDVLIKGMIVQSGNDATIALAERVGGTEDAFVQMMNQYAQRLGMKDSHFDDSTGLPSPNHYTTAHDLGLLVRALIHDYPQYYSYFSIREFTWNNIRQQNRDGLLGRDPGVDGLKTGHTDAAGYCLVSSAKRGGMRLIAVVLDSSSWNGREAASSALLNYGFNFFQSMEVEKAGATVLRPRVYEAVDQYYPIGPAADVNVVVPREQAGTIQTSASLDGLLIAPLTRSTRVGQLQIVVGGRPIESVPLYPLVQVPRGGFWSRLSDHVRLWLHHRQ